MDPRTQPVDARTSLAAWLRDGRTQKRLTIAEVAKITKIQLRILERLESGHYDGLPAEVFVKGFVRSFAKCVGLDESEALEKYGAAQQQQQQGVVVAQALAETLVPITQRKLDLFAPAEVEPPVREAPLIEARVLETKPEPAAIVEAEAKIEITPLLRKKQRNRKRSANQAPRSRRKKAAMVAEAGPDIHLASLGIPDENPALTGPPTRRATPPRGPMVVEVAVEAGPAIEAVVMHVDTAPSAVGRLGDGESREATSIEAKAEASDASIDVSVEDGAVDSPALAEGSQRISQQVAVELDVALDAAGGTWQPTMPTIASTPSVPWRRPHVPTATTYVVPTLVIDDADPDSADRERDERAAKEPHRLSFLPPILLDREDRAARQGGLTLAVIILLIAATLTLSYLMRRPSSRGDGVTMVETPSMLA